MASAEELLGLIEVQADRRHRIGRIVENARKSNQLKTLPGVTARLQVLASYWAQFVEDHRPIRASRFKEIRDSEYIRRDVFGDTEELYLAQEVELRTIQESLAAPGTGGARETVHAVPAQASLPEVKLPRVPIPTFDGAFDEWRTFRDLFLALVGDNKSLADVHKMHYLKQHVHGEPERFLRHHPVTGTGYKDAWAALCERYDNERLLVEQYLHAFFALTPMRRESAAELRRVFDRTCEIRSALGQLGRPTDHWNDIWVYRTVTALDAITRRDWERATNKIRQPVRWITLADFLKAKLRELEAVDGKSGSAGGAVGGARLSEPSRTARAHTVQASGCKGRCTLCSKSHPLWDCATFRALKMTDRRQRAAEERRCFNCLSEGHQRSQCDSARRCKECSENHHTLLHPEPRASSVPETSEAVTAMHATARQPAKRALLATARIQLYGEGDRALTIRALLDPGSEGNLISESVAQQLRMRRRSARMTLTGATDGRGQRVRTVASLTLRSTTEPTFRRNMEALVVPRLTAYRPSLTELPAQWSHLVGLPLADDLQASDPVMAVLGAECYAAVVLPDIRRGPALAPIAQATRLGWVLLGSKAQDQGPRSVHCSTVRCVDEALNAELRRFWELEEVPTASPLTPDEEECERQFSDTHTRQRDGRYLVRLPLRPSAEVGDSKPAARASLARLERRLEINPELRKAYHAFLDDYERRGHMRRVSGDEEVPGRPAFYLPHHPVIKGSGSTLKLRVVFNASQSTATGLSLNAVVQVGPRLQQDLGGVLLRWRMERIVFIADIEQMYRQIVVHPEHQPLQRILWRPSSTGPVHIYQLCTVTYGTACAPFLALRVLQQLARDEGARFPRAAELLRRSTYVDDVLAGAASIEEALTLQTELTSLLRAGGFSLKKWAANSPTVLESVPMDCQLPLVPLRDHTELGTPVLGVQWIPEEDVFGYGDALSLPATDTKRSILSTIARIFDPLGWISPVVVSGKMLLQELWLRGVGWDTPLLPPLAGQWHQHRRDLEAVKDIRLPRWTGYHPGATAELHGFCDASERAFAAAVYIVIRTREGSPVSRLLVAKSKVAPVKRVSLPRLELCGAHLLARLMRFVRETLPPTTRIRHCWTDSAVALTWIQQHPARWETFVANRVGAIHELLPSIPWGHVPTKDNPADCASRGISPRLLREHNLWWSGPAWIRLPPERWPRWEPVEARHCGLVRVRAPGSDRAATCLPQEWEGLRAASSYRKALRILAYVLRFLHRAPGASATIDTAEYRRAEERLLAVTQRAYFATELDRLREGRPLPSSGRLRQLQPALGADGLLHLDGRLRFADLAHARRHPVLLPREAKLTELLIRDAHERTLHGGVQLTHTRLRQRFWIPAGRALVRQVLHRCVVCARHRARPMIPVMAPLPRDRATPAPPFHTAGVDYAGPVALTAVRGRGRASFKGYIAVFVCFATRAIHLELVGDYTSEAFLAAFHRFAARRGLPAVLYSDQGTTFVGAARELRAQLRAALDVGGPVAAALAADGTDWRFVPPAAPHFGGLWEAGVRSVKHHLRRVLGDRLLSIEEFSTWLVRVEACLNSRPLSPLTTDPEDLEVLTPRHFLIGRPLIAAPEPGLASEPETHLNRWQLLRRLTEHLWDRWSREYLTQLQARRKWNQREDPPKVGELVVLLDQRLPPTKWAMGRLQGLIPGPDGQVRVARVKTTDTILTRPLVKLVRLPVQVPTGASADQTRG